LEKSRLRRLRIDKFCQPIFSTNEVFQASIF